MNDFQNMFKNSSYPLELIDSTKKIEMTNWVALFLSKSTPAKKENEIFTPSTFTNINVLVVKS